MANSVELLREMSSELAKLSSRQDGIEKTITRISKTQGDESAVIKRLLGDGRGAAGGSAAVGFDGCDTLGILRNIGGVHQKSLGCGSFLTAIANATGDKDALAATGFRGDQGVVRKTLDSMNSRLVQKTALAEGSGVTGGYTVPVQFYADLLRLVAEDSFVRKMCTVMPMQAKDLYIPALTQSAAPAVGTSAFFGGVAASWQPEAATINESEPSFRQVHLVARDLMFYTVASNQLLQDNAVALDTLLTTLFKEAMSWFYDYYILRGNGAAQPLGVQNAPALYSQARKTTSHLRIQDLANMLSRFLVSSWKNGAWIIHPSVLQDLLILQDPATDGTNQTGRLSFLSPVGTGVAGPVALSIPMTILGLPVYLTEKTPQLGTANDVTLCDLSKMVVGDRMAIQIEASPWPKFLTNQMVWRIIARWDAQPWLDAPVILADGAQTYKVSPFVGLAA